MNGIEITVDHESLSLQTEVMTLRDALNACRSSNNDLEPTEHSSGGSSDSLLRHLEEDDDQKCPFEEEVLYQNGATLLFKAIEDADWREALRIIEESPSQVRTWVKSTGTQNTTFDWSLWRRLPIHEACRRQAPAWLVSSLLSVYPEAARCATQFGELPLHLAVGSGASPDVVNLIVVANMEGIAARDKSGRAPLEIWDECELLVDEDRRVVCESLTRCLNTYNQLQASWQQKVDHLTRQHDAAMASLKKRHKQEVEEKKQKQAKLEANLNKLHHSVQMLTSENTDQGEKISSFAKVERGWQERVNSLSQMVDKLKREKAEEEENVEALHQLVEDKDEEIIDLSTKVRKLTKDLQHITSWYDQTEDGLSQTQEALQKMVDNYVEVHGKLTHEREALKKLLVKRAIQPLPKTVKVVSQKTNPPSPPSEADDSSAYEGEEAYSDSEGIMDEAANAAAAAASAALTGHLIADPD